MPVLRFPDDFLWGTATASYQIEGSPLADGAGESIWHRFAHTPGNIERNENGDVACDHYRLYGDDVALMRELGLGAYRFSIAWPRVLPSGRGAVNERGLDFYERLVDRLLDAGIAPMATLYHWDLPQALEDEGGWPNPDLADAFADYADAVFGRLGDRVKHWISFNEPWVFTYLGYGLGLHAPGRSDFDDALAAGHTVVRAHAAAAERFRNRGLAGDLGLTVSVQAQVAAGDNDEDRAACERTAAFHNHWFTDPLFRGDYPAPLREQYGDRLPEFDGEDRQRMAAGAPDFVGVNYYTRARVRHAPGEFFDAAHEHPRGVYTAMGWEIYPAGLYAVLGDFAERYRVPLYVTENGAGFEDETADDNGVVDDPARLRYLQSHLEMVHRAISDGVDVRGYMAWSFLDNFEWAFGYSKRFGIVRCDYESQRRTPKASALWYRDVIREGGI